MTSHPVAFIAAR